MKNLRDIEMKAGDIIYFEYGRIESVSGWEKMHSNYGILENSGIKKIERPVKYETIYEEPKQILDKFEGENK